MNKLLCLILSLFFCSNFCFAKPIRTDKFLDKVLSQMEVEQPVINSEYDFSNPDCVQIPMRITKKITTSLKNKSYEGERLEFIVDENVYYDNELLVKKGEVVTAKIEIMTTRGFVGVPAEIFIFDFNIPNLDSNKIEQPVSRRGFSTTTLILPIKWALTPFPPLGSITNIFVGFNASLTPKKVLKLNYYPKREYGTLNSGILETVE